MTRSTTRVPAPPPDVARPASALEVWRALHWTVLDSARHASFWVVAGGGLLLATAVAQYLAPGRGPRVTLLAVPAVALGHALVVLVAACTLVGRHDVLVAADGSAVLALRHHARDGETTLRLTDHVARRIGTGAGRRLRTALAPYLAAHVVAAHITTIRLTGVTSAMTERYASELVAALPGAAVSRAGRHLTVRPRGPGPGHPCSGGTNSSASSITPSTS